MRLFVTEAEAPTENVRNPDCAMCRLKRDFDLPDDIIEAVRHKKLIVFAGAGASTEGHLVLEPTLYEDLHEELQLGDDAKPTFSSLMSQFCGQTNGRRRLLQKVKARFEFLGSFNETYFHASRFHQSLATIPYIQDILTTNWDDLFERECNAIPIVSSQDFAAFSNLEGRKVLKLHGSINNIGSMVLTDQDYDQCYVNLSTGVVGAVLKFLLMSKVILFIGYSFDDEDFVKIYSFLKREVGELLPQAYMVTMDENIVERLGEDGIASKITPIITDATFFMEKLKQRLVELKLLVPDIRYEGIMAFAAYVQNEKKNLWKTIDREKHPSIIFSSHYQDGIAQGLTFITSRRKSGEPSHPNWVPGIKKHLENLIREMEEEKDYQGIVYLRGFEYALRYFLSKNERENPKRYFMPGKNGDVKGMDDYIEFEREFGRRYEGAAGFAEEEIKKLGKDVTPTMQPPAVLMRLLG